MLLKSKVLEDLTMLEPTVLMVNGIKSGDLHQTTSRIPETISHLMLKEEKMLKVKQFGLGNHTRERTNNGIFFILKIRKLIPQSSTEALR
jgi:hypothetical protein